MSRAKDKAVELREAARLLAAWRMVKRPGDERSVDEWWGDARSVDEWWEAYSRLARRLGDARPGDERSVDWSAFRRLVRRPVDARLAEQLAAVRQALLGEIERRLAELREAERRLAEPREAERREAERRVAKLLMTLRSRYARTVDERTVDEWREALRREVERDAMRQVLRRREAEIRPVLHLDVLDRYHGSGALVMTAGSVGMILASCLTLGPLWAGFLAGALPTFLLAALVHPEHA